MQVKRTLPTAPAAWLTLILVLLPAQRPAQAADPLTLEFRKTFSMKAADDNWADYEVVARYELEIVKDPFTGQPGAKACSGFSVDVGKLKNGDRFCFRLRFVEGRLVRGAAYYFDPTVLQFVPPTSAWNDNLGFIESRADGRAQIRLEEQLIPEVASGGEEGQRCEYIGLPKMILTYEQVRDLSHLDTSWEAKPLEYDPKDGLPEVCSGTIKLAVRAVGPKPEVLIWAEGYDSWLPAGRVTTEAPAPMVSAMPTTSPEEIPGAEIRIKAALRAKDGSGQPVLKAGTFRFELEDVSDKPGVSLNWPSRSPQTTPDLGIVEERNPKLEVTDRGGFASDSRVGIKAKTKEISSEAELVVSSFDWGAFGAVRAYVDLEGETTLVARLRDDSGDGERERLRLPKRAPGSKIASAWKSGALARLQDDDDAEADPAGDGHAGDGLTLYEEYRGVVEGGKHTPLDPHKKDFFVVITETIPRHLVARGLDLFRNVSGLAVHDRLRRAELDSERVINFNSSPQDRIGGTHEQHGVVVFATNDPEYSKVSKEGVPRVVDRVTVPIRLDSSPAPDAMEKRIQDMDGTVAHELLHACNVIHHDNNDESKGNRLRIWRKEKRNQKDVVVEYPVATEEEVQPGTSASLVEVVGWDSDVPVPLEFIRFGQREFGLAGGICSGEESCVMRYNVCNAMHSPSNDLRRRIGFPFVPPRTLCGGKEGSSFNAAGHKPEPIFGPATKGNCRAQICVNDRYH